MAIGLLGAVVLAVGASWIIDHRPMYDELLHVLAARGVMQTGEPAIAGGIYDRAELFTRLVAVSMTMLGDSLVAARIPALACGGLLIVLISVWSTVRVGWIAGLGAALLLASLTTSVSMAVFARFYTLHALAVALGLILAYEATLRCRSSVARLALAAGGVLCFLLALHLQETTFIAAMAGMAAVIGVLVVDRWTEVREHVAQRPLPWLLAALAVAAIGAIVAWQFGLIERFQSAAIWAEGQASRTSYYLLVLAEAWPLFWPLWPAAFALALLRRSRVGLFCGIVFVVAIVMHSLAGMKAPRYLYYAMPFGCIVLGIGAAALATRLRSAASKVEGGGVAVVALAVALVTGLALSQEAQRAVKFLLGKPSAYADFSYFAEPDWPAAMPILRPLSDDADRVLVSAGVKGLYFLGRYDYEVNTSVVQETATGQEFGQDLRTGRQAISSAASVDRVVAEPGRSLVIVEEQKLGRDEGVPREVVDLLQRKCSVVNMPAEVGLSAWLCG
jgi:4-amino-4-deoxy-L-arabinose transferase-like glycosyltransferase